MRPIAVQPRPAPAGERGATLVELLIALLVLSFGVLAVAQVFPLGSHGQLQDRLRTSASYLVQEKLEDLSSQNWGDADLDYGAHGPETVGPSGRQRRTWLVEAMPSPLDNLKRVTVTVSWDYLGTQSVAVVTYKMR